MRARAWLSAAVFLLASEARAAMEPAIVAGYQHACILDDSGVSCWGNDQWEQRDGKPSTVRNPRLIAAGAYNTYLVDDSGIRCWGRNLSGICKKIDPEVRDPQALAAGMSHACAIQDGKVICWGSSAHRRREIPRDLSNPREIAVGVSHACVIHDGGVKCWGKGDRGELDAPADLVEPHSLVAGAHVGCVIDREKARCWGDFRPEDQRTYSALTGVKKIALTSRHACAWSDAGVTCWGANDLRQSEVPDLPAPPISLAVGQGFSCALVEGKASCWGEARLLGDIASYQSDYFGFELGRLEHELERLADASYSFKAGVLRQAAALLKQDLRGAAAEATLARLFVLNALEPLILSLDSRMAESVVKPHFIRKKARYNAENRIGSLADFGRGRLVLAAALRLASAGVLGARELIGSPGDQEQVGRLTYLFGRALASPESVPDRRALVAELERSSPLLLQLAQSPRTSGVGLMVLALKGYLEGTL